MDLVDYKIVEKGEIITFKRKYIDESGKMDCAYSLWRKKGNGELVFGMTNSNFSQLVGILVKKNYENIVSHLEKMINSGIVKVFYKYLPAPIKNCGSGFVCEVVPTLIEKERKLPQSVINKLKEILIIIKNSKGREF